MKTKKTTSEDLYKMLCKGAVKFQFTKKDGSIRTAVGTLNPTLITFTPSNGYSPSRNAGYQNFFDLENNEFRCYNPNKIIGIVE